ncbi:threonine ammonia-lyase [Polymorphobacter fuscus]|uniref:Threonine ammonia-lyase n=1 Tax=Sandarakinorhabdus fusca TaxID=1439888 RepID=A0A7C9GUK9_9SPHN|nr:threonine ammonia-lyase [Polymorphobacter fuscus]KAB7648158.1 threonine ammonia-lyase [Polymorphobacter fuscus]MQT15654.1 threonine ammonia-lyase [Polymorphobacter fuscus]NJC08076.1 threonine dehydratase [Polymorphobacter fuscus]
MTVPAPLATADLPITYADVEAAARAIDGAIIKTPCLRSQTLSDLTGADVWLKFENLQFTAAYKERGALNKLLSLTPEERKRGVIAASAGNHAQGLAYHARRLGIPATIVMPKFAPVVKVQQTEGHGAHVVLFGESFDEASAHSHEIAAKRGLVYVPPFDDALVMAGQGTVGLEMLDAVPDLDTLIVPIGGGGLISGIATVAKARNPAIEVIGVQAELYPSMHALLHGETRICDGDTLAEGIAVKVPGKLTSQVVRALVDDILLVGERDLEHAVSLLLTIEKTVVEGAGAAGLAALLANPRRFRGAKIGLVLCGGNIDTRLLANVLLRELARSGRLARLRIRLKDRPGQLFEVARIFDQQQVNILEVYHQRVFTNLPAKGLITDIECETRDREHLNRLVEALRAAAYEVRMIELD